MRSVTDSEAVFKSRALHMGLAESVVKDLETAGIKTLGAFAFASSYLPGSPDDKPFVEMLKTALTHIMPYGFRRTSWTQAPFQRSLRIDLSGDEGIDRTNR